MSETLTEDKQTINTLDVSEGNLNAIVDDGFDVIEDSDATVLVTPEEGRAVSNEVPNSVLFEAPVMKNELPKLHAEFVIAADRATALSDVVRIQSDIKHKRLISIENVSEVDALVPGFINDENPAEQYTQEPSRTNVDQGLNDIDTFLEKQYDDLRTSISSLAEQYQRFTSGHADQINKQFYAVISRFNKAFAQLLHTTDNRDIYSINFILNNGVRWGKFLSDAVRESKTIASVDREQTPDRTYNDTFVQPLIDKVGAELRHGSDLRFTLGSMAGRPETLFFVNEKPMAIVNSKLEPVIEHSESDRYSYYSALTYGNLMMMLTGSKMSEFIMGLHGVFLSNLSDITETSKMSEVVQEQNEPIATKIKNLTIISSIINKAIQENQYISTTLEKIFTIYLAYIETIESLAQKQK